MWSEMVLLQRKPWLVLCKGPSLTSEICAAWRLGLMNQRENSGFTFFRDYKIQQAVLTFTHYDFIYLKCCSDNLIFQVFALEFWGCPQLVACSSSSVHLCLLGLLETALWNRNFVSPLGCLQRALWSRKHFMIWVWTSFSIGSHTQQYHVHCKKDSEAWLLLLALWKPSRWTLKSRVRLV